MTSLYLVFMYSSPHSYPAFVQTPLPRQTTQKRRQLVMLPETLTGTYTVPPSLEISMIHSATLVHSNMAPAELFLSCRHPCCFLLSLVKCSSPMSFLEDCCLNTLRSHSSPLVPHWRPENGSFSCFIFLVLCVVVNLFNVCSELINNSTQPSFFTEEPLLWW